ncbi:hypothetical protein HYS30_03590 [Candidatus Peregrinibacteria bacterium]|nr:hypothetical protein [Candidatus Peregrinibacteria bacterium]
MELLTFLQKRLYELPEQIKILEDTYRKLSNEQREEKLKDLRSYEKRLHEGLTFLLNQHSDTLEMIERVRHPSTSLLSENTERYFASLRTVRKKQGIQLSEEQIETMTRALKNTPLTHTTNNVDAVLKDGILPASTLWMMPVKSCANAMDIALGLDQYVFLTHGFGLSNFSDDFLSINNTLIELPTTLVSSVDIFKLVLIETGRQMPCAAPTHEWLPVLDEYQRQIFSGKDFWRLKAEYVLTYFKTLDEYQAFATRHFYENFRENAPDGEQPFLGEVKVLGTITGDQIAS